VTDDRDAFGHLLWDCLAGQDVIEVIERDDGFIGAAGSARRYFTPFRDWAPHERRAIAWARGRVLDIGCGAGRHALHLQEQGFAVTGIDLSPLAISVCRRRGLRDAQVVDITQVNPNSGPWDTLLLLGANLGLAGSVATGRALLARLAEVSSADARMIAESRDPSVIAEPLHVAYREANARRGRLPGQLTLRIRYHKRVTPWFEYLFLAKGELDGLLAGTQWRATQHLDDEAEPGAYIALIEKVAP